MHNITKHWYQSSLSWLTILLLPFSWLFHLLTGVRRWLYQTGILSVTHLPVPVIIVGNIAVGGTGKTPFVVWLAQYLAAQGYRPGVICRGVGSRQQCQPFLMTHATTVDEAGDEAVLLFQQLTCPIVVGKKRALAAKKLLDLTNCNVIISDDGLQHYRLGRDIEIALIDGERRFGNGCLLPAGPLRESKRRLKTVHFTIVKNAKDHDSDQMRLLPGQLISVMNPTHKISFQDLQTKTVRAIAGIAHPKQFFNMLKQQGLDVETVIFPDHYHFTAQDILFHDQKPIMMTHKDAVKCQSFADERHWYVQVETVVSEKFQTDILGKLNSIRK